MLSRLYSSCLARGFCSGASVLPEIGGGSRLFYEILRSGNISKKKEENIGVVLHGLLGTGRNLRTFASQLLKEVSSETNDWTFVLMDLRHHGKSHGYFVPQGPDNVENTAKDVIQTMGQIWSTGGRLETTKFKQTVLIGHSLGGKVALSVTKQLSENQNSLPVPSQTWLLDSSPFQIRNRDSGTSSDVLRVLEAIRGIKMPLVSRDQLYTELDAQGFSKGLQQWLGSNLINDGDGKYTWNFNFDGVVSMFDSYLETSMEGFLAKPPHGCSIHLVRALKSNRWDKGSIKRLDELSKASVLDDTSGTSHIHELENAGHWLHAENPKGLIEIMAPNLT
jgi:pimeloyl-ACP methyl ester carboxylesterase